ncbi:MAG TPA: phage/plasmid primase, P4 family [Nitrosopumilaceae archaeon]|nr:phage/plasmid primase, P4 family [Nitrosopumilaceae archaeon]
MGVHRLNRVKLIKSLQEQGYKLKYIPENSSDPKACTRKWKTEPGDSTIPEKCNYIVVQEGTRLVLDIDAGSLNFILDKFKDQTLVVQTGGGGTHGYFEDIVRANPIRSSPLYLDGKHIGDIKAAISYVVGPGSIHRNGNEYKQISSTDKVLKIDFEKILQLLKENNVTTSKKTTNQNKNIPKKEITNQSKFEEGLQIGERNTEIFKLACSIFEKPDSTFDFGLNFIITYNEMQENPLDLSEIKTTVKSAWKKIQNKKDFEGPEKINNVATRLREKYRFLTLRKSEKILLYNGKIYDNLQAEARIKEETEVLIPNCTTNNRMEVINKIKAQTFTNLEDFDSDPMLITIDNGILNLKTSELSSHTPEHLSRVLLPVKYITPKYEIKPENIFEDIEKNLCDTLFWKFLKSSFTVDGNFRKKDFEMVLEIIASTFVKHHIDEKAFMFLGPGDNGKSVLLVYIESILGKNNVSNITLQDISDDKFMRANLSGKSANIFTDLEKNELRHTGKIKSIVSNEGIDVQEKHQQGFTLHPFCKLLFSCNGFPKVYDQGQGFFRRWIIVKWNRNFENDPERDEHLKQKLKDNQEEKNLVFSCLVQISKKLIKTGKFTRSKNWKVIQKEWNENADPIDDFNTNYVIDSENNKSKRETYNFYKEVALSKGETPLGMGQFSKAFGEYHEYEVIKGYERTERVWLNIDFKQPKQTTLGTDTHE